MRSDERHFYENQYHTPPTRSQLHRAVIGAVTALGALLLAASLTDLVHQQDVQAPGEQNILEYNDNTSNLSASDQ